MSENWNGVPVYNSLLKFGTRRSGQKLRKGKPEFIVAHDTGNIDSTARGNIKYYNDTYNIDINHTASAHIFVDDKEAVVCIPTVEKAWHVRYDAPMDNKWYNVDANDAAIGIEICYFRDKKRSQKSLDNGARVLAYLAEFWGIDYKTRMPGHQDLQFDKQDPGNVLAACGYGRNTSNLDKLVAKYYKTKKSNVTTQIYGQLTRDEFVEWLEQSIGKQYDADGYYGFQCYDYANAGWKKLYPNNMLHGIYAKNIAKDNAVMLNGRATVYHNTPKFLAKKGDMVLFQHGEAGHVAWVLDATLNKLVLVEQNWLNGGWTDGVEKGGKGWETVTKRVHQYEPNMIFIRPNFAPSKKKADKQKKKNTKKQRKITWNWSGRYTVNTTVKVRRAPGLSASVVRPSDWLFATQWVDIESITKKDGYWWGKFKYPTNKAAGYFYCALCKITDPKEQIRNEKYYGTIKWDK